MGVEPPLKDKTGPREIAWFVALWLFGVGAVMALAYLIRLFIR
jgi:hypothetical protein